MAEELDEKGYPLRPRNLSKDAWFYETKSGLEVVIAAPGAHPAGILMPWRKIEAAANRHRAIVKKRKRRA